MSQRDGKESKPMWVRTCPECGEEFRTERSNKRYCKDLCRVKAWQKQFPRIDPATGERKQRAIA
jgi:hypothetical protein